MPDVFSIDPDTVYTDGAIVLALGVTHSALATARRSGELRYAKSGRKIVYRGRWLLNWLEQQSKATAPRGGCNE